MSTRIYIPATPAVLAALSAARELGPSPLQGFAVTSDLRAEHPEEDEDGLEYIASDDAARASLDLLAPDPATPRRVVLAADVAEAKVTADPDRGLCAVTVSTTLAIAALASLHIDDVTAESDVRAAVGALPAAEDGDEAAADTVDGAEAHELLWYATQELEHLLAELGLTPQP